MADITAAMVKVLRERTGAGMMECKKALVEAQGNIELAIDQISQSGKLHAANKAGRMATEGIILTKIAQNGKYGVIIELNCETDFVAKDSVFSNFGAAVITTAMTERISNLEVLKDKFEEQRIALVSKIGENINIRRLGVMEGNSLGSYLHYARIGVIVAATGANKELMKHIAMHIAASKPKYVNTADIPADVVAREHQNQLEIAIISGKTLEIAEKIAAGKILKFTGEISLTGQQFVMDPSKTVGKLLEEHNAQVKSFIRFELGEGIEKTKFDFTAEVSAMETTI